MPALRVVAGAMAAVHQQHERCDDIPVSLVWARLDGPDVDRDFDCAFSVVPMPRKTSRSSSRFATKADIAEIHRIFDERKEWLEKLEHTCSIQFARIAQMQAELDEIRRAWSKVRTPKKR